MSVTATKRSAGTQISTYLAGTDCQKNAWKILIPELGAGFETLEPGCECLIYLHGFSSRNCGTRFGSGKLMGYQTLDAKHWCAVNPEGNAICMEDEIPLDKWLPMWHNILTESKTPG